MAFRFFLNASFFTLIAAVASRGAIFAANIFLARNFTQETFGLISFAYLTALNLGGFASSGMAQTSSKIIGNSIRDDPKNIDLSIGVVLRVGFWLILFVSFLVAVGSDVLSHALDKESNQEELSVLLKIAAGILFFTAAANVLQNTLFVLDQYKSAAFISIVSCILMLSMLAVALSSNNSKFSLIALGLAGLIQFFGEIFFLRKFYNNQNYAKAQLVDRRKVRAALFKFLKPALLVSVIGAPIHWACMTMLARGQNGMEQLAFFNAAFQFYLIVLFFPSAIGNMSISIFSKTKFGASTKKVFIGVIGLVFLAGLFVGAPLAVFPEVATYFYGASYTSIEPVIKTLAIAAVIAGISISLQQYLAAQSFAWINLGTASIYSVFYLALTFLFVNNSLGAKGVADAILTSACIQVLLQLAVLFFINRKSGLCT